MILLNIIEWLEEYSLPCIYHKLFGIECPACGSHRALTELLKGNVIESIKLQPALISTIILLLLIFLQIIFRFNKGWYYVKLLAKIDLFILIIGYIYKLIF